MGKSVNLVVRMSQEELEALRAHAAREGYDGDGLSEWVRRVLFRRVGLPAVRAQRPKGNPNLPRKAE